MVEMKVALVLVSVFFTKALALQCSDCFAHFPETCNRTLECPTDVCNSVAATFSLGGVQVEHRVRACLPSVFCAKGRINTGFLSATINSKCCKTDLCNDKALPALPKQPPNGKKCCTNDNCSETVSCEGDEDHCIKGTAVPFVFRASLKGCASKSICERLKSILEHFNMMADIKCCKGNLCNQAL
ncbi:phospholipase A2 inhibitor CNF-like [Pygocentrus nattereri]|nr:phospholipase A2 inhibitor CNF-like [Pygocentrus nattereri]